MIDHRFIGIFGMMGSGKSVLVNEYLIERPEAREIEFVPPPVEAKFRGMNFEFVDQIFAIRKGKTQFNFYELDAPTINKWTQFISITNAIIIAYNYQKEDYFESPKKFIENLTAFSEPGIPFFFVVNAVDAIEKAEDRLEKLFNISSIENHEIHIMAIPEAEIEFTQEHGRRVRINISLLDKLYSDVMSSIK